jgi:hypothetical protein
MFLDLLDIAFEVGIELMFSSLEFNEGNIRRDHLTKNEKAPTPRTPKTIAE